MIGLPCSGLDLQFYLHEGGRPQANPLGVWVSEAATGHLLFVRPRSARRAGGKIVQANTTTREREALQW